MCNYLRLLTSKNIYDLQNQDQSLSNRSEAKSKVLSNNRKLSTIVGKRDLRDPISPQSRKLSGTGSQNKFEQTLSEHGIDLSTVEVSLISCDNASNVFLIHLLYNFL